MRKLTTLFSFILLAASGCGAEPEAAFNSDDVPVEPAEAPAAAHDHDYDHDHDHDDGSSDCGSPDPSSQLPAEPVKEDLPSLRAILEDTAPAATVRVRTKLGDLVSSGAVDGATPAEHDRLVEVVYRLDAGAEPTIESVEALPTEAPLTVTLAAPSRTLPSCESEALRQFGPLPAGFPSISFPRIVDCDRNACIAAQLAYLDAVYAAWLGQRVFARLDLLSEASQRTLWSRNALTTTGSISGDSETRPSTWFAGYDPDRYEGVRAALRKHWEIITERENGSTEVRLRCPTSKANLCATAKPSAHHAVLGQIDLCDAFFSNTRAGRAKTMIHEFFHHLRVSYFKENGIVEVIAPADNHVHWHGSICTSDPQSGPQYGKTAAKHLASYKNSRGNDCSHAFKARQNVDNYTYFLQVLGKQAYAGNISLWPAGRP